MIRTVLLTALLTGAFCSVFAVVVDLITNLFSLWQLMLVSFCSGALGSLFAQTVIARFRAPEDRR